MSIIPILIIAVCVIVAVCVVLYGYCPTNEKQQTISLYIPTVIWDDDDDDDGDDDDDDDDSIECETSDEPILTKKS